MNQHTFTPATATTFDHGASVASMLILAQAAESRGCECAAYEDWFTYRRWRALGYQVQKGEHGVRLTTFRTFEETRDGKTVTKTAPWHTTVFCRHQVEEAKR